MWSKGKRIWQHGTAWLLTLLFILPFFWLITASLRPPGLPPPRTIEWWPSEAHWQNYAAIFELLPMTRYLLNSLIVVSTAVPLTLLTASLAGFSMTQLPPNGRRRLLALSIGLLIVPAASVWLFRFQILRWLGLVDTLWALIVPAFAASNPLFVLLFYWSFRRTPADMYESARLDGISVPQAWWQLALPLARPTTTAVTVLAFVFYWSDFISPLLYIYQPHYYTLPVGLQILKQFDSTNWPLLMAAAVVMMLPVMLLFGILQRAFLTNQSLANLFDRN